MHSWPGCRALYQINFPAYILHAVPPPAAAQAQLEALQSELAQYQEVKQQKIALGVRLEALQAELMARKEATAALKKDAAGAAALTAEVAALKEELEGRPVAAGGQAQVRNTGKLQ